MVTGAQLVAQDGNDDFDVYDARVGGVRPPVAPECSGTGCQGVPSSPPVFATPPSVTFNGVGNFPAEPENTKTTKTKSKPKPKAHKKKKTRKKTNTKKRRHAKKSSRAGKVGRAGESVSAGRMRRGGSGR
jgi:hypothetical protein